MRKPTGDDDAERTGPASGNHGSTDPGAEIVGDVLAVFLADLASINGGAVEELRRRTERAGELLRAYGLVGSRAYREELRRARRLVDKLYEIVEADLDT